MGKSKTKPKSKPKNQLHGGEKRPPSSNLRQLVSNKKLSQELILSPPQKIPTIFFWRKKYWVLAIVLVMMVCLIWYLSQLWLVRASFSVGQTYPKALVLGVNVGSLDAGQLNGQLNKLKTEFETKKITLINDKKQWVFDGNKLGVIFDAEATSRAVWKLNNLSLVDKYRLLTGDISPLVVPTILINYKKCTDALSIIPAVQIAPTDALVYYDQGIKIKPDQSGMKFNATLTCKDLPKLLAANAFITNISLDTTQASLTKANLDQKLPQIQSMVGEPLTLKSSAYQQTLTSDQLFTLLDITGKGSDVKVAWSSDRLDEIVNSIAGKVDTYNAVPALGACQYVSSTGGYWLDKAATKKIFTDIGADSSRSYNLPIVYHASAIINRTPVAYGNSGTVYLTFDDGMTYANQIMDYASCYGIKVTFFEIGERVGTDAVALRRAIAEGHAVQSHGHYHAMYDYGQRSYDWQYNDINQSIIDIMSVTGVRPTYFRPPGGNRSADTYAAANANGLKLILWGLSSADATVGGISSSQTCSNVLAGIYPGASVLMHSIHQSTANAVPCIIEGLAARGYNMQALR